MWDCFFPRKSYNRPHGDAKRVTIVYLLKCHRHRKVMKVKNFILAGVVAVFGFVSLQAGDAPKAQAPVAPVKAQAVKGASCCEGQCATVEVARRATLRERRNLMVVEKVPVKVVEVKKAAPCDCCNGACVTASKPAVVATPVRRVFGRTRSAVANVVDCVGCK